MADGRQPTEDSKKIEPVVTPTGEQSTMRAFLEEAYAELGKLGIGPLSTVKEMEALRTQDSEALPPVDLFDSGKLPMPDAPVAAVTDGVGKLILPIKLEMPALKFEGDGYSVSIAPTGNPLKHKGGIEVKGAFTGL
ncbi:MAG: hypothetical protein JST01_05985 [Cyanobacteria bacterium SZAS TMP-1]|nr:hypothetical protein [Cyanobacteria bacterium SZAS TMP-1]